MNPELRNQLERIEAAAEAIAQRFEQSGAIIEQQQAERDELQRENWTLKRTMTATAYSRADVEALSETVERLRQDKAAAYEDLKAVLEKLRALRKAVRS